MCCRRWTTLRLHTTLPGAIADKWWRVAASQETSTRCKQWKRSKWLGYISPVTGVLKSRTWYNSSQHYNKLWFYNIACRTNFGFSWITHVLKENQVTYLGGIITKEAKGHAEVEQRIAATMATWKKCICSSKMPDAQYGGNSLYIIVWFVQNFCMAWKRWNFRLLYSHNWKHIRSKVYEKFSIWNPHSLIEETRTPKSIAEHGKLVKADATKHRLSCGISDSVLLKNAKNWQVTVTFSALELLTLWDKSALEEIRQHHIHQHADD